MERAASLGLTHESVQARARTGRDDRGRQHRSHCGLQRWPPGGKTLGNALPPALAPARSHLFSMSFFLSSGTVLSVLLCFTSSSNLPKVRLVHLKTFVK